MLGICGLSFFSFVFQRSKSTPAVTDTVPRVSRAGLPVRQVLTLTAGQFLQEHLGRCLCGFLRGPCDDPGEQEKIHPEPPERPEPEFHKIPDK